MTLAHSMLAADPLEHVWRALADPTRRSILDLLRIAPRTTGHLAAAFPLGRCAVMKHLEVLTSAGLVLVRRTGRERWNHLNVVPLQQIHDHFVRPFEALWARPLLRLKYAIETPTPTPALDAAMIGTHVTDGSTAPAAGMTRVELEIRLAAPVARVWQALTEQVDLWWPRDFFASADPQRMRFDARLGGQLVEEDAGGGGVIWYTVYGLTPGESLDMVGHLSPAFGGPTQSLLRLALRLEGAATVLSLTDAVVGNVGPGTAAANAAGWRAIFETAFTNFVERTEARRDKTHVGG